MKLKHILLLMLLCGCQERTRTAHEIIALADQAIAPIRSIGYDFEYRGMGATAPGPTSFRGSILLERMSDSRNYRMHLEGRSGSQRVEILADGKMVFKVSDSERTVWHSSIFAAGSTLRGAALPAIMEVFLKPSPFGDELSAESAVREGTTQIAGVTCDLVRVSYAGDDEDSRWCFSTESHLPLRLEWISDQGSTLLDLSNLTINPSVTQRTFEMDLPEGYVLQPYSLGLAEGSPVPAWSLREPAGNRVSSGQLLGNVVVLDFWASWCPPCIAGMRGLQRLREEFEGKPVRVFGVNVLDTADPEEFLRAHELEHHVLLEGEELLEAIIGGQAVPTIAVIDAEGRILGTGSGYFGEGSDDYVRGLVQRGLDDRRRSAMDQVPARR